MAGTVDTLAGLTVVIATAVFPLTSQTVHLRTKHNRIQNETEVIYCVF